MRLVLMYVRDMGKIMMFPNANSDMLRDYVIVDPGWFGTEVVGRVLASKEFTRTTSPRVDEDGVVSWKELEKVLVQAGIDEDDNMLELVTTVLEHLGLCYVNKDRTKYVFPSLLTMGKPSTQWEYEGIYGHDSSYVGMQLACSDDIQMFSPGILTLCFVLEVLLS